jgi:hypothetical protein
LAKSSEHFVLLWRSNFQEVIKKGILFGLLGSAITSGITLILYMLDKSLLANWLVGIVFLLFFLAWPIIGAVSAKRQNEGHIALPKALLMVVVVGMSYMIGATIFAALLYNVVDPDLPEYLTEASVEQMMVFMDGMPEEMIDEQISAVEERMAGQTTIVGQLTSLMFMLVVYSVLGVIVALIIRSKNPQSPQPSDN